MQLLVGILSECCYLPQKVVQNNRATKNKKTEMLKCWDWTQLPKNETLKCFL